MTNQCDHGQLARTCLLCEMRDENLALRAKLADCQTVIRHKGHDADCPAVICGRGTCRGHKDKPYHFPSVDPDDWCHFVPSGPCSESCGHDRTTETKA